ncbi:MAG TPA: hypothetical protein VHL50_01920, partial [Pyrinomonadaceae bacterium]|nr:hypothetical protein [Pyrinomonadaceae bacterium]
TFAAGAVGLENGNFQFQREGFDGGGMEFEIAAARAIGLADDGGDFGEAAFGKGFKAWTRDFGGPEEYGLNHRSSR